jgi:DNA processing protein
LGTKPESYNFPIRNEIVAGLSQWILVVEAWIKSGTLITANLWLEQGKDIFAVPWNIFDSSSDGTNMLIATGQAKCTLSTRDIIQEYEEWLKQEEVLPVKNIEISFTENEAMIIHYLKQWINTIEGISLHSNLSIQDTTSLLTMLEMNWYIELDILNNYHIC